MPRKKPFSGKQKKKQLQDKRIKKQGGPKYLGDLDSDSDLDDGDDNNRDNPSHSEENSLNSGKSQSLLSAEGFSVQKIHEQPDRATNKQTLSINNFRLHFFKDSDQAVERGKKDAMKAIRYVDEKHMELGLTDVYPKTNVLLDFPKRPTWNYNLTKEQLDAQELQYFKNYVSQIIQQERSQELSYFELNLETWRQLWRVLELSDVLLVICDARYPVLHLPPSLLNYIVRDLHKFVVIILNKIDFLPPLLVSLWKSYLESQFPTTRVVLFSSFLKELHDDSTFYSLDSAQGLNKKPRQGSFIPYGPSQLLTACNDIVKDKVDLSSWREKLEEEGLLIANDDDDADDGTSRRGPQYEASLKYPSGTDGDSNRSPSSKERHPLGADVQSSHSSSSNETNEKYPTYPAYSSKPLFHNGVLTLGCIGFPNAGKSSVLNTLVGKKVVSVSQTPGHTKHFQTIFLSPTVKLCDCPGLVFPSLIPKGLQVIAGIYPVAHVREPYSVVGYLAKRVNLPRLLNLQPPDSSPKKRDKNSGEYVWSAYCICEAWAMKNGFTTSKAGRPDVYRAANKILRMAVEGQILLYFKPPDYARHLDQAKTDTAIHNLHSFLKNPTCKKGTSEALSEEAEQEDETTDEEEDDDENVGGVDSTLNEELL